MPALQQQIIMPSISLSDWLQFCCSGNLPASVQIALQQGGLLADLVRFAWLIGALEPLCATRPGVCDPVVVVDKEIVVPPATLNPDGTVKPSQVRAICYCAPTNRALVVQESRITAGNLTGASQPTLQPFFKRVNVATFPDAFCLPFEPEDEVGLFSNVEHVVVPPKQGYCVFAQNFDVESEAVYHLHSKMWACC